MKETMGLQNTPNGTNENSNNLNSSELIIWEDIPNTPFKVTGNQETGYFLVMGSYRITEPCETIAKAEDKLYTEPWNIQLRLISIVLDFINNKNDQK